MALPAERFTALTSPLSQYSEATLFLGKRKNSSGEERLVYVTMHGIFPSLCLDDPVSYLGIDIRIYQSGTWLTEPRGAGRIQVPPLIKIRKANEFVRFFAGQPASDDASHFSIAYEIGDKRSFIDGCLMDDDSVKLEKRR